jgi:hypothetical protein
MRAYKLLATVMVTTMVVSAFAGLPGVDTLKYDDGSRYRKVSYGSGGVGKGWGVKFEIPDQGCAELLEAHVNLCPPELDATYWAEVVIYAADGSGGAPGTELGRKDYQVRVGEWWHYVDVTNLGIQVSSPGFYVFSYPKNYPHYIYQWFDRYDQAPAGTQWYYNGTSFATYESNGFGDIGIRALVAAHDVEVNALVAPSGTIYQGTTVSPSADLRNNVALWGEDDVPVRFWVVPDGGGAAVYDETVLVDFPANTAPFNQAFPDELVDWPAGNYVVACSVALPCDYDRSNDKKTGTVTVEVQDVGAVSVDEPVGTVSLGQTVVPKGTVKNFGTVGATFNVRFHIEFGGMTVYEEYAHVSGLAPGAEQQVSFPDWIPSELGDYTAHVTTLLSGDANPANDHAQAAFDVASYLIDVGVIAILNPPDTIDRNSSYPLKVTVKNFGVGSASFVAHCRLTDPDGYVSYHSTSVNNLGAGATRNINVVNPRKFRKVGVWFAEFWTELVGDENPDNDSMSKTFVVVSNKGWHQYAPVTGSGSVNRGAALAAVDGSAFYLLKGRKSPELYYYDDVVVDGLESGCVPEEDRKVGSGTEMVCADGKLYLLKANRSSGFMSLDLETGEWMDLAAIPGERPPKKGAAMTVREGSIYVLKGNRTNQFYRYDPAANEWTELAAMPVGPEWKMVKGGGALTVDGDRIFAFKGYRTTEFYTYHIPTNVWQRLADIPVRRVKDGACLVCIDGAIYATIGGNKMEFWTYDQLLNAWTRLEDVPRDPDRRKVKYGAAMIQIDGTVLLLKGRKSTVLLAYEPGAELDHIGRLPTENGAQAELTAAKGELVVAPNPTGDRVSISYGAAGSLPVSGRLYNSSGQLVREFTLTRTGAQLDATGLANGVYLVSVRDGSQTTTKRLVIQH